MAGLSWKPVRVKLKDLRPWERNPRRMSKRAAERLLAGWHDLGQVETLAIGPNGEVYDGHQRLSALRSVYGEDYEVLALQSSRALTEKERERLVLLLHAGAMGQWDWEELANWEPGTLLDGGIDEGLRDALKTDLKAVDELLASMELEDEPPEDPGAQVDRAEELREKWGVEPRQLWRIPSKAADGEHRIVCGDSTDEQVVRRVMGGEKAIVVSDPPYGISVDTSWLSGLNVKRGKPPNKSDDRLLNDDGTLDLSWIYAGYKWLLFGFPYVARYEPYSFEPTYGGLKLHRNT